mgnify:CR=1 FL=1|jgi:hypothetical protein|tara:strand:- start:8755 stop:9591 length:837 start_codon:yes stop_codon:yes gene_type:complete
MADDVATQEPAETIEAQPPVEEDAQEPTLGTLLTATEPDAEAIPESTSEEPPPEELSTPDVSAMLSDPAQFDAVMASESVQKALKQATADEVNKARQEEQKRISREAGADDRVVQAVEGVLNSLGVETTNLTAPQVTALRAAFSSQGSYQAYEQARTYAARSIDQYKVEGDVMNTALEFLSAGEYGEFVDTITSSVVTSEVAKAKTQWETEQTAEVNRRVNAEIAAKTKQPLGESIPEAPSGVAAGSGPTPQEYANASPAQRAEWATKGVEVSIPASV